MECEALADPITQALIAAMAHSTEPMALTDPNLPDNPMIAINQAFTDLSGYRPEEALGRNCRFLQGAGTDAGTPPRIRTCLEQQRGCVEWIVNYRKDGSMFWNLLFLSPVFDRHGNLLHFFGNQRNITEGPPSSLPDYVLGKADMPAEGGRIFDAILLDVLEQTAPGRPASQALEHLIDAARRLDDVTVRLTPARWSPPPLRV
jgi:PAS domain S-box-containing protein